MRAIVTVKLPRNPIHNPRDKKRSICPLSYWGRDPLKEPIICTDVTGTHHSYIEEGETIEDIEKRAKERFGHVTRTEVILP